METVFESSDLEVRVNTSGEIFVRNKRKLTELRINETVVMAWKGILTPTSHNGISAFRWDRYLV
jgi:hypothetical protein